MKLKVSDEFSKTPGHRSVSDGAFSGDQFLDTILKDRFIAAQTAGEELEVNLDDTAGYPTSFLEAAFGGLTRQFSAKDVLARLKIVSEDEPYLVDEIISYIHKANK